MSSRCAGRVLKLTPNWSNPWDSNQILNGEPGAEPATFVNRPFQVADRICEPFNGDVSNHS